MKSLDLKTIPLFICGLLPLTLFAHTLSLWNKGNSAIPQLLDSLSEKRSSCVDAILEVTEHTGLTARALVTNARQVLQGREFDTHSSVFMCLMMYVWATHPKSKKRDLALLAIQDYVIAETNEIPALLQASAAGKSLHMPGNLGAFNDELISFPGCQQLDPSKNPLEFAKCWGDVFVNVVQTLTHEVPSKTNTGCLDTALRQFPINPENRLTHPLVVNGTTVAQKSAALLASHRDLKQQCKSVDQPDRAPTEYTCMKNLLLSLSDPVYREACTIISHDDLTPNTYSAVVGIALRAEKRHSYQLPLITECSQIRKSSSRPSDDKKPTGDKASDKSSADPDKKGPAKEKLNGDHEKKQSEKSYEARLAELVTAFTSQPSLEKRKTAQCGKHNLYERPPSSSISASFRLMLCDHSRCQNCGDCDPLFPSHDCPNFPYVSHNPKWVYRDESAPVSPIAASTKQISGFPVGFHEYRYMGTTSKPNPGKSDVQQFAFSIQADVPSVSSSRWEILWSGVLMCLLTIALAWITHMCYFLVASSGVSVPQRLLAHPAQVPSSATADTPTHEIFLGFDDQGNSLRIGIDSYCEGSLISSKVVGSNLTLHSHPVTMKGIGGVSVSPGYVELPFRFQWGARLDHVCAYVVEPGVIPHGVDVLLGLDAQQAFQINIDTPSHLLFVRSQRLEIPTEVPAAFAARMATPPLTVVATNSGPCLVYCTLRNLGFRIRNWYITEIDDTALAVAAQIVPSSELRLLGDTFTASSALASVAADLHISTPPCVSWSSLRGSRAKGFGDPSADVFRASAAIHDILIANNPNIKVLVENVVPHQGVIQDVQSMAKQFNVPFTAIDATALGSPANRKRLFGTNIVNIADLPRRQSTPAPNRFLRSTDVFCPTPSFPCLVASDPNTKSPIRVYYVGDPTTSRSLTADEAEAIQGWPGGISDGPTTPLGLTRDQRVRLLGNALNAWHVHAILKHLSVPSLAAIHAFPADIRSSAWKGPDDFSPTVEGAVAFPPPSIQ